MTLLLGLNKSKALNVQESHPCYCHPEERRAVTKWVVEVLCTDEWVIENPMKGSLNNEKHLHGLQCQTALSSNLAILCNLDKLLKPSKVEFSHLLNGANSSYCRAGGRIKWDRTCNPPAQSKYSTSSHQYGLLINGPTLIYLLSNYFTCDFLGFSFGSANYLDDFLPGHLSPSSKPPELHWPIWKPLASHSYLFLNLN